MIMIPIYLDPSCWIFDIDLILITDYVEVDLWVSDLDKTAIDSKSLFDDCPLVDGDDNTVVDLVIHLFIAI